MFLPNWRQRFGLKFTNRAARRRLKFQPKLQALEPRSLLSVSPTAVTITPTENAAFTGTVATFTATDSGPFSATIDWGDGTTTAGTVTAAVAGGFNVTGSHSYADEGTDTISVTIADSADATTATATSTAVVAEGDTLSPTGATISSTEQATFTGAVATFSDTNAGALPADFTATIVWGDGTTTAGIVSGGSGTDLTVSGSHSYAEDGAYTVTTTIADDAPGTATGTATSIADIAEADLTLTPISGFTVTQGQAASGFVATISDPGSTDPTSDFSASINWGDGTPTEAGTINSVGGGSYQVSGSHTYIAAQNTASVGATEGTTFTGTVATFSLGNVTLTVTATETAAVPAATADTTFSGTINGSYPSNPASSFTATIDWGDGTTTVGTISGSASTLTVSGTHLFADEGSFPLAISLSENSGGTATATGTAQVADGDVLAPVNATVSATEGTTFTGTVATFTNTGYPSNPASDFTATVDWGDGTTTAGTVGGSAGTLTVSGMHLFADEGSYPLAITLNDDAPGTATATATGTAQVADADALVPVSSATVSATEGTTFTGTVATFTNTGYASNPASDFTATVDWGDGTTTAGTVSGGNGADLTVSGSHSYAEDGAYTVTTTIADDAPGTATGTATATANIAEANLTLTPVGPFTVTEGATNSGALATISDPGSADSASDFSATIDWGDGTTTTGTVTGSAGTYSVSGMHAYADEGNVTVTVTASETSAVPPATASTTVSGTVTDADTLAANTASISATEGTTFTGTVATFTNAGYPSNPASDFTATIEWGDGTTTTGTVGGTGNGTLTVSGTHRFADEGSYPLAVTLNDDAPGTATATATGTAQVADADVLAPVNAAVSATEGTTVTGTIATFSNTGYPNNPASDFTATIDWGDGTTTAGTVGGSAGTLTVSGTHLFADEGSYPLTVTLNDDAPGTATATATGTAQVADADVLAPVSAAVSATEGTTFTGAVATFSNTGYPNNPASDFTATIDWGDGTTTAGTVGGSAGTLTVGGTHLFADEGSYPLAVTLNDDAPGTATATATGTAQVADADVLAPVSAAVSATEGTTFTGTVATFTNTGYPSNVAGDFTATINWGDGTTTVGAVSGSAGTLTVSGTHLFVDEGSFPLTVTLNDDAPGTASATATGTAQVADADVLAPAIATLNATEGTTFTGAVATFTNTGYPSNVAGDFAATINWGDGTTAVGVVSGSAGTLTVSGTHLFADEGSYPLTITLSDDAPGTASATATGTAQVADADVLAPVHATVSATEGTTFTGAVATFTNTGYPGNPAGDFTATINWGDGTTTTGIVSGSAGTLTVSGTHLFVDEGSFPVMVTLNDDAPGTASATATGTAQVADADVLAPGTPATFHTTQGATFTGTVATFTNTGYPGNPASDFTATIKWGDGTTTVGTVSGSAGTLAVAGSHVYASGGTVTLSVVLQDDAPGTASATATATMNVIPTRLAGVPGDDTPQTFLQNLYRELLDREPDAAGLAFWVAYLEAHNNAAGRLNVIEAFMNSAEYKNLYVTSLYEIFLGRGPEASALQYWTDKMGNPGTPGQNSGSSGEKYVLSAILGSDEFYADAGGTPQGWINALYEDLLGRSPDGSGAAFWANELAVRGPNDRDGIVRDLLTTPEAAHDLLDTFYPTPGGTTSTPLAAPGTPAGTGRNDLSLLTGAGWENLYFQGPYDSQPEGNDGFFASLIGGGNWDDIQLLMLSTDQYYSNPNRPITA